MVKARGGGGGAPGWRLLLKQKSAEGITAGTARGFSCLAGKCWS